MPDIKLFSIGDNVRELVAKSVSLEKELQNLIENNMQEFFGVRFLRSEYIIADGRIDSLGIDENNCPVIFEYKRSTNDNVINQGLFYLNWLLDHKADFTLLVMNILGKELADNIDWSYPCVICIASDFNKYDFHALNQMNKNIKLVKYKKYRDDLILFEHFIPNNIQKISDSESLNIVSIKKVNKQKTFLEQFESISESMQNLYISIKNYILSLGDDVSENQLKLYVAFRKVQNIVCVQLCRGKILLYVKLNPNEETLEEGFTRDTSNIGHYGTGNLEITISNIDDFEKAKYHIDKAYNLN